MNRTTGMLVMVAMVTAAIMLPPAARAREPDTNRAAQALATADSNAKQAEGYRKRAGESTGELQSAALKAADARAAEAEACRRVSAAWASGDETALATAEDDRKQLGQQTRCAETILSIRQSQAGISPNDTALQKLTSETPPENKALLDAVAAARQKALAAADAWAAAITPESSSADVAAGEDSWILANDELALALNALRYANTRAQCASRKGADDPAAAAKLAEMAKIDEEVLAAQKTGRTASFAQRTLGRKRWAAEKEFEALRQKATN